MRTEEAPPDPAASRTTAPATNPRQRRFEYLALVHVGVFLVACTWAFGGNAAWVQAPLAAWGSLGAAITLSILAGGEKFTGVSRRKLVDLWPFLAFNALVLASTLTPNLRAIELGGGPLLVPRAVPIWRPSSAQPALAALDLWIFDAVYLSCFNLAAIVRRRRALRALLLAAMGNALLLGAFGTVQKLAGAKGLFFGLVRSPQPYFFSTFVYDNHWGAFMILMVAVCLGLAWHYGGGGEARDALHSPAFGAVVTLALLAATAPLSGSRGCTLILTVLLGGAFACWVARLARRRRRAGRSAAGPVLGAAAVAAVGLAAIVLLDSEVISARLDLTRSQLATMREQGGIGSRTTLYRDTWHMARDNPWFGWGMGSYLSVFVRYNTQKPNPLDNLPNYYRDAHSDWLQSAAEHGLVGSLFLGLCAAVPFWKSRRSPLTDALPGCLLVGCAAVLLYAWVEFPFGNFAVALSWWFCFFCALRTADLSRRTPAREGQP